MLKMMTLDEVKAMVDIKSKETPVPAVPEPVAPLRNVGALVPGDQPPSSIISICKTRTRTFKSDLCSGANSELVERAKAIVDKAVRQHKIFVVFGQYNRWVMMMMMMMMIYI